MRVLLIVALLLAGPALAQEQDETLADIRQEMSVLFVEVQRLKRELSTTGAPTTRVGGETPLERIDAIEAELQRLTSRTEELEFRIDSIVRDGTNRLGDLEFRLVELEGGELSQLGETSTLGGGSLPETGTAPVVPETGEGVELAVGEQADFDRARAAFDAGDSAGAADGLERFLEAYPGSPLAPDAHFLRGEALAALGETAQAARAYLSSFSGQPGGPFAASALLNLGRSLGDLGQTQEACITLGEVRTRFPGSDQLVQAQDEMSALGCL